MTEAGTILAAYAARVVEEIDNAQAALEAMQATPRGDLTVSAPFAFTRFVLAPNIGAFHARYPDVRLALDPSLNLVGLVEEGIDVAIRVGELAPSSLIARQLGAIPLALVASPDYLQKAGLPKRPEDLRAHALIDLRRNLAATSWHLIGQSGQAVDVPVRPFMAVGDPGLTRDMALAGAGITVAPARYVASDIDTGSLVRVLPDYHRGAPPIHAVYPSRAVLAPKTRAFIDFVIETLSDPDSESR